MCNNPRLFNFEMFLLMLPGLLQCFNLIFPPEELQGPDSSGLHLKPEHEMKEVSLPPAFSCTVRQPQNVQKTKYHH